MKESVEAARTVVRSRASRLGITYKQISETDIHVHFPEGAVPKDGPSAGSAITLGLVSALTGIPVKAEVAMTGEITLRGEVLPIGGLKEKLLAALRGGIKEVLIPEENVKDLEEVPENVKEGLVLSAPLTKCSSTVYPSSLKRYLRQLSSLSLRNSRLKWELQLLDRLHATKINWFKRRGLRPSYFLPRLKPIEFM